MRAASSPGSEPSQVSKPRQSLPLHPVKPIKRDEPREPDSSSHRRKIQVIKSESAPQQDTMPQRTQPTPSLRGPTPEEVMEDPLVRSVLDVFEGEIKRVHPKNK